MNTNSHITDEIYEARKLSYEYHITAIPLFIIAILFTLATGGFGSHGNWIDMGLCAVMALAFGSLAKDQWALSDNWSSHADRLERSFYDV